MLTIPRASFFLFFVYWEYKKHYTLTVIGLALHRRWDVLIALYFYLKLKPIKLINHRLQALSANSISPLEYLTQLRIENARTLLNNPNYTLEYIAAQCGFKTARQLQRILKS